MTNFTSIDDYEETMIKNLEWEQHLINCVCDKAYRFFKPMNTDIKEIELINFYFDTATEVGIEDPDFDVGPDCFISRLVKKGMICEISNKADRGNRIYRFI